MIRIGIPQKQKYIWLTRREKTLGIMSCQRNVGQSHREVPSPSGYNGYHPKDRRSQTLLTSGKMCRE